MTAKIFLRRPLERLAQLPAGRRVAAGLTLAALVVTLVAMGLLALQAMESAGAEREHLLWSMGALVLLAVVTGTAIGVLLTGGLKAHAEPQGRMAERLAEADMGADLDAAADDEVLRLQQAVAEMQERLRTMVGAVREAADVPAVSAAATVPVPASLPPRPAVTDSASPDQLVAAAVAAAERGGKVVSQVVANLDEIATSSRKIGEIVSVIDNIAFQTNLLALNAAVQAAKAGAQGGGFAMVAGEVRGLAQRAANAAKEIKGLVNASTERVESGGQLVRDASATMEHLMVTVQSVTEIIGRLGGQAVPQHELAQVGDSMHKLEELTQRNVTLAQESAGAAEALRSQAERLQKVVGAFRLLQQTQEAAWTAHNAITSARERARGSSQGGSGMALWGQDRRPPATPGSGAGKGDWENF
jgi:methyl-accepting chemotaxis protein